MSTDWTAEQREIHNDLLEDGVIFTITRTEKGYFDPILSEYVGGGTVTYTAPGIVKMPSARAVDAIGWQEGTTVQGGDKILLVSAGAGYEPKLEDVVTVSGQNLKLKAFTPLEPGEVALLYYLLVRKA